MDLSASYCGPAPDPAELFLRWNVDPPALALLAAAGVWAVRARRGRLALGLLALVYVSPLCALGSALFAARVAHHVVLMTMIAALVAAAAPARGPRHEPNRLILATAVQALALWVWHAPGLYAWAATQYAPYWLMQASLLGAAVVFWREVRAASAPAAAAALLATVVQSGLLGALITFAATPLYAPHLTTTAAFGLSPLADQQIAGLIMWAPMAGGYLLAALAILFRWLGPEPAAAR